MKLAQFGLVCNYPKQIKNGAWVLGLEVRKEPGRLLWRWGTAVLDIPDVIMWQTVFSLFEKLVGNLPVCGWLRRATGVIKHSASTVLAQLPKDGTMKQLILFLHTW